MTASMAVARTALPNRLKLVLVLLGVSVFINYVDRGNLSIAAPMLKDELGLSAGQLGLLLSAFFWTYACMQPVMGWLVDRLDVNWVMAGGFFLWSMATAVTGLVHGFAVLFAVRLVLGVGEAVAFPSYSKIIALHFPEEHRGRANSVISAGLALGPGLGILAGGILMGRFGWRSFFIVLGLASLIWLVPWIRFMPKARQSEQVATTAPPRLSEFLQMRAAWGTCVGLFSGNYINYFLITWLPYFMVKERHFSMDKMARVGSIAYLLAASASLLGGWLSDRWIARGTTPTIVRKTFTAGGVAIAGVSLGLCPLGGEEFSVAMIMLGMIGFGMSSSNVWAITQTLAGPQAAGRWTGFQNCVGNMAGIVAPALSGFALQRTGHFAPAFAILTGVALIGTLSWIFVVGPVQQVEWGMRTKTRDAV